MSVNGPLSGITFGGLASGIDTTGIIQKLIQVENIPVTNLQNRQQQLETQQAMYVAFGSKLTALQSAAAALSSPGAFNPIAASSSDATVATITATSSATAGSYQLTVSKLAQAQKVSSAAQSSTGTALNLTGSFVVNGKGVTVGASDSLSAVAQKINSAGAGVVASVIDGGPGNAYLSISSSATGAASKIQLADSGTGTVLSTLGFVSGAAAIREAITNGATSYAFSSGSNPIGSVMGLNGLTPANITINGAAIAIDPSTQSLQTIANNITSSGAGVTATVRTITDSSGHNTYKLDIVGNAGTPTFADDQNFLQSVGVLQRGYSQQLVAAQDADYHLDGVHLTSASNTITTAIPGATLTLLKADNTTPPASTLSLTSDTSAISKTIGNFKDAYNGVMDFITQFSQFDSKSYQSGPLFGDAVAQQVQSSLSTTAFNVVPSITGTYNSLAALGFSTDKNGDLQIDSATLTAAIQAAPTDVAKIFETVGNGSADNLVYIASSSNTVSPRSGGYGINLTQIATQGSYTAETAQTQVSTTTENLTFSGALVGTTPYHLVVPSGNQLSDTVALINNDAVLKNLVVASINGGKLQIQSKKYGTNGNFLAVSDLAAGPDNSGIGLTSAGTTVTGVDTAGTIGGEAATGNGQFLTGNKGNANTDGLEIQYTGNALGGVGSVSFSKGVGTQIGDLMSSFMDPVGGLFTSTNTSLQSQVDDIAKQITDLQAQIALKQADLRKQFAAMETAISTLQAQGQRIAGLNPTSTGG